MKFLCPHCAQRLDAAAEWAGSTIECPVCGQALVVPVLVVEAPPVPIARPPSRMPSMPRPTEGRAKQRGGGIGRVLLLVIVTAGVALGYACYQNNQSPQQLLRKLVPLLQTQTAPTPALEPTPESTPAPEEDPPTPEAMAAPTLEPTATPIATATPPPDPVQWIATHKDYWPKQVVLRAAATFPIIMHGRVAGAIELQPGAAVELAEINRQDLALVYQGGGQRVSIDNTDLRQRALAQMAKAEAASRATPAPAPIATPSLTPMATPPVEEVAQAAPPSPFGQSASPANEELSGQGVALRESDQGIVLSNGIVTATITKGAGVSSLKYRNFEMTTGMYYSMDGGPNYRQPGGGAYFVKTKTPDLIDIGFKNQRKSEPQALDCEVHYALKRGSSGLYTYAMLSHPADYPKTGVGEWRMVWKLSNDLLEKIYVDDLRHWQMPSAEDYKHAQPTGIKEIVKINTGVRAGQFDCKYDFSASYYDIGCWGHASDKNKVGGWIVLGGYDYFNDGPTKQDLNAASGINHIHFGMDHYNGSGNSVETGEEWRKIYGPFLLYCNHSEQGGDAMWADAKKQVAIEKAAWPYAWLTDTPAYPPANARGALAGHLVIKDTLKPTLTAANAWVGLAQPPPGGNWQFESNHYQYWAKADAAGNFTIPNVRPGIYTFYAYTNGAVGEYSRADVEVKVGTNKLPEDVIWKVPRKGRSLAWEIGIPDRSAQEFRHGADYFHGYVWTHFQEEFKNPLEYTVGQSDWSKDWNYAQSWYQAGTTNVPWRWRIHFNLAAVPAGDATMTFAFASAHGHAKINVYVNSEGKQFAEVTPSVQGGNALLRESIHAKYCVEYLTIPTSRLRQGVNTITLEQVKTDTQSHVMYDYLSLELP